MPVLIPLVLSFSLLGQEESPSPSPATSEDMITLLAEIMESVDPLDDPFAGVPRFEAQAQQKLPAEFLEQFKARMTLALEALRAGRTRVSIQMWTQLRRIAFKNVERLPPSVFYKIALRLGTCYLRLAEEENCLCDSSGESCLFPVTATGRHQKPEGAQLAFREFKGLAAQAPNNGTYQWLLSLSSMILGQYPAAVPKNALLPESVFIKDDAMKPFKNIASKLGVDVEGLAGGTAVDDFDGDGDLDIIASSWSFRDSLRFLVNQGDGTFVDRSKEAGLDGIVGGLNLNHADYDNDGFLDVLVLRGGWRKKVGMLPNSLLRNDGKGGFVDVTHEAGLLSLYPTQTAQWGDFDQDGDLDLFIGNESDRSVEAPCELYLNQGDGTFRECAREAGLDVRAYVKGVAAGDIDNDGWMDLYLSILGGENRVLKNLGFDEEGQLKFEDVSQTAGAILPIDSFPTWFWDFDADGDLDLFAASYDLKYVRSPEAAVAAHFYGRPHPCEGSRLYRNEGDGTFTDISAGSGLDEPFFAMGCNFGDVNGDGYPDAYIGTGTPELSALIPNRLFEGKGDGKFIDRTFQAEVGHLQKGHGVSFADFDHDGDLDIYAVLGGAYPCDVFGNALFENPGHSHAWLTLQLRGTASNHFGLGCRLRATLLDKDGQTRVLHRRLSTGGSFGSSPYRLVWGLGDAVEIKALEISWPSSSETQVIRDLSLRKAYEISEGVEGATPIEKSSHRHRRHG